MDHDFTPEQIKYIRAFAKTGKVDQAAALTGNSSIAWADVILRNALPDIVCIVQKKYGFTTKRAVGMHNKVASSYMMLFVEMLDENTMNDPMF